MVTVRVAVIEKRPRLTNRLARSSSKASGLSYHWLPLADDPAVQGDPLKSNTYDVIVVRISPDETGILVRLLEERPRQVPVVLVADVTTEAEFLLRDLGIEAILPRATCDETIHKTVEHLYESCHSTWRLDSR
ncbi:MAG: hypothetical protein KDA66_05055 [Planctomycetaceae bacterium]|nr:hypothetical protein [Planctomycetaceae bacterium]